MVNFEIALNNPADNMKHEKVKAILDKKMSDISKLTDKVAPKFDEGTIHDLRTRVKSLRAMMRMYAATSEAQFKLPKKFKKLYSTAGVIRESQLEIGKMKQAQLDLPQYKDHLNGTIGKEIKSWKKKDLQKAIDKLECKINKQKYGKINVSTIKQFVDKRMAGIETLCVSPVITDEMMHSMRKLLKDVMYVIKSMSKVDADIAEDLQIDMDELVHHSQLLGDYNDARIMLDHLVAFAPKCTDAAERKRITELCEQNRPKLPEEKSRISKELLTLVNKYVITGSRVETELPKLIQVQ